MVVPLTFLTGAELAGEGSLRRLFLAWGGKLTGIGSSTGIFLVEGPSVLWGTRFEYVLRVGVL
jgi:hypothetical protein